MELLESLIKDYTIKRKVIGVCSQGRRFFLPDYLVDIVNSFVKPELQESLWCKVNKYASPYIALCESLEEENNCYQAFLLAQIVPEFPIKCIIEHPLPWRSEQFTTETLTPLEISVPNYLCILYRLSNQSGAKECIGAMISRLHRDSSRVVMNVTQKRLRRYTVEEITYNAIKPVLEPMSQAIGQTG